MLEQRRAGKRRQHFKKSKSRAQIDGVIDCSANGFDRISKETDHEEAFGVDPFVAANHVRLCVTRTNFLNLRNDIFSGTCTVWRRDSVRTVRAEFRTAPAR